MKKHLLSKLLLLSALLGGVNSVWAQAVPYELDGITQGWVQACNTAKKIDFGQTRTITFTVDALKDGHNEFAGYMINLTTTATAPQWIDQSTCRLVYRAYDWWAGIGTSGQLAYAAKSTDTNDLTQVGDEVVATIEHKDNGYFSITYKVTRNATETTHYYECSDFASPRPDTYVFLCADQAKLTITSDVTTGDEHEYTVDGIVGGYTQKSTIGQSNKSGGFFDNPGNSFVIKKGQTYKLNFKNSGTNTQSWFNWIVKFVHGGTEYFARSDWYAVNGADWGVLVGTFTDRFKATTDGGKTTSDVNWDTFKSVMSNIADVDLTITYTSGGDFKIQGTSANGDDIFYYDYSLGGFTNDITVTLGHEYAYLTDVVVSSVANTGANGITTFSSSYHLNLDGIAGATAYSVLDTDASSAKLTTATGTVTAGEGLFLKGEANAEVTIPLSSAGSAISGNMLVGSPVASTIDNLIIDYDNIYVLGASDGKLHNVATYVSSNTLTIPACKAFLRYSGDSSARDLSLIFDDAETTGVQVAEKKMSDNAMYFDLMGRRVAQPTKGLYIVNGKKIIVK